METFVNWCEENKINRGKVAVKTEGSERSLYSLQNINKGDDIVFVNASLIITSRKANNTILAKKADKANISFTKPSHTLITAFCLEHINKSNSIWHSYFAILPKDLSNFPIYYDDALIAELGSLPFVSA